MNRRIARKVVGKINRAVMHAMHQRRGNRPMVPRSLTCNKAWQRLYGDSCWNEFWFRMLRAE